MAGDDTPDAAPEPRNAKYERQTKEQFETLGRFVQAFELMVDAARNGCLTLAADNARHARILRVVFHYHTMTAQPLFDMWRGIVAEFARPEEDAAPSREAEEDRGVATKVLAQMADEYGRLARHRNDFLHGTWFIGWAGPADQDFSRLNVFRARITKGGFAAAEMPKDVQGMSAYINRFESMALMLQRATFVVLTRQTFSANFVFDGESWRSPDDPRAPKSATSPRTRP